MLIVTEQASGPIFRLERNVYATFFEFNFKTGPSRPIYFSNSTLEEISQVINTKNYPFSVELSHVSLRLYITIIACKALLGGISLRL